MKVLLINGSPRQNGNTAMALAEMAKIFTENGIEFYPHKINISTEEIKIPANMIEAVKTNKIQIRVISNGKNIAIVVSHNKEWKKQIEATIVDCSQQ